MCVLISLQMMQPERLEYMCMLAVIDELIDKNETSQHDVNHHAIEKLPLPQRIKKQLHDIYDGHYVCVRCLFHSHCWLHNNCTCVVECSHTFCK